MDGQTSRIEAEPEESGAGGPEVEHFDVLLVGAGLVGHRRRLASPAEVPP
jgi:hypothetical protein